MVAQVGVEFDVGVNVYVVFPEAAVEIVAGDQEPAILPLLEVAGKMLGIEFSQNAPSCVNVGVVFGCTVIGRFAVVAHIPGPGFGVKV